MAAGQVIPPGAIDDDEQVVESSLAAHEEAYRGHQVATAKRFPRSLTEFRKRLTAIAMLDQRVAQEMVYSLPRAGKQLIGPSIRFAEAALSCYGNSNASVEVIEVNTRDRYVVAEGRYYDAEQNVAIAVRVRRRNVMKKDDADSYQVTGSAASSIALRGAILRGVPKALWTDIFEKAIATAAGDVKSIEELRQRMVAVFRTMQVTDARLFKALGVAGISDINQEEIVAMNAWHKQLREREVTIEDIFGYSEDDEIDVLMEELGYNPTQKRMGRQNYKGRPAEHLAYLRDQASKAASAKGSPIAPDPHAEEKKPEPTVDAVDKAAEVVAEVSKHPEPQPEPEPQASHTAAPAKSQKKINW